MEILTRTLQDLFKEFLSEYHDYIEMARHYGVTTEDMKQLLSAGYMLCEGER